MKRSHESYNSGLGFDEDEVPTMTLGEFRGAYADHHAIYFQYRQAVALERIAAILRRLAERA